MSTALPRLRTETVSANPTAPHLVIQARAGTGKTTTLVEGLKVMRGGKSKLTPSPQQRAIWEALSLSQDAKSVAFVAFNKSIAEELQSRVPEGCQAMTMHSLGFAACRKAFGKLKVENWRVKNLIAEILGKDLQELRKKDFELLQTVEKLVGLCKVNLLFVTTPDNLDNLCAHYDLDLNGNRSQVFDLVPQVLEACEDVKRDRQIDFNDMIWLPVVLGLPVTRYDVLLVDEAQDLNRCQQELAKKAGERLVLCGDDRQAIYGFAGADSESLSRMVDFLQKTERGAKVLPLTVTRRCGKAIVEEAREIVPDFEAHEDNGPGEIHIAKYPDKESKESYLDHIQDGDMALCRVNAPLVSQCFRLLKDGRKATIQGRDIGQGLISTIKKMKASDLPDLSAKLSEWHHRETEKENRKRNPNEARMIALQDRYDCLTAFCENARTIEELTDRIENVFQDGGSGVKFSSIHRAKGLEADRVFFLRPEGAGCPHPMAKTSWQQEQEMNLKYVAITRAIKVLVHVS